jgi:hypothetical protein
MAHYRRKVHMLKMARTRKRGQGGVPGAAPEKGLCRRTTAPAEMPLAAPRQSALTKFPQQALLTEGSAH